MSTPSLGGASRSVQVILGANAGPAVQGFNRFGAAATEAGKRAEKASLAAKAASDKQAKAVADAAKATQAASAKAAKAQLDAVKAAQAHAAAVEAGAKKEVAATKAAADAAKLAAQEQAAAAKLVRAEQAKAASAATAAARQQAAAAREAAAQAKAAATAQAAAARQLQAQLLAGARAVAAAQRQQAAERAAMDRLHGQAIAENARRELAAQRTIHAAARQAAAEQAAYDRQHAAAIAENARRTVAAQRAQAAAATAAARQQLAAQRAQAAAQAKLIRDQLAMSRLQAAAIAENARRTQAAAAAQLAAQRRLGQQMANDLRRQTDLDRQHQDALDENARRDANRQRDAAAAQKKVGGGLLVGGAVAAAGVLVSVAAAAKLEQAISRVGAATGASAAEMVKLREAAIEAGERTQYSSVEAAQGIEQLAKAGVSVTNILGGGLDAALDLAASDGIAVGDAAQYMASTLTQFNLAGSDATHVADLLAAAAGEAQGGVADAALALEYVGTSAAQAGIPIEQTVGAIALLASNGVLAEKAGTGLRGVLLSLTSPSKKAATELESLGINLYDQNGKFVGIRGAAEQLQKSLGPLTEAQRNYSLGVIFGNAQQTAATILLKSGASAVDDWTAKVDDQGRAARVAAERTDNLIGDVERLGGAFNTALVGTGEGGLAPLRVIVKGLNNVVSGYNDSSQAGKNAILVFGAVTSAAALAGGGFLLLAPRIVATRAALATLGTTLPRTTAALRGLGAAAAGLAAIGVVGAALGQIEIATRRAAPGIQAVTGALLDLNDAQIDQAFEGNGGFEEALDRLADPSKRQALQDTTARIITFGQTGNRYSNMARDAFKSVDEALTQLVQNDNIDRANAGFERLAQRAEAAGIPVDKLRDLLPGYQDALKGVENQSKLSATGQDTLGASVGDTADSMEDERTAAERLRDALDVLNGGAISVTQAQIAFRDAQREGTDALEKAAKASKDGAINLNANSKAGGENLNVILGQIQAAENYAEAIADQAAATTDADTAANKGRAAYAQRIADLRKTWREAGLTNAQIKNLIATYAQKPERFEVPVSAPGALEAARQLKNVTAAGLSIPDKFRTGAFVDDHATPVITTLADKLRLLDQPHNIRVAVSLTGSQDLDAVRRGLAKAGRADGGPIPGPFVGPKADNVLIAATPGEYMQQHSAVQHYGLDVMDAINQRRIPKAALRGYADGGPILGYATGGKVTDPYVAAGRQYQAALAGGADAAEIAKAARELERLAQAWRDANDAADKAGERAKLVQDEAKTARALAKADAKDRKDAKTAHDEATKALRDYDKEAKRSRQDAALAGKETLAQNRAEYEFGKLTQADQLKSVQDRLKGERKYSDEWIALAQQRDSILADQAEKRAEADRLAQEEADKRAANQTQYEFDQKTTAQQLADVDLRIAAETKYSDTWVSLAQQRGQLQQTLADEADQQDKDRQDRIEQAADRVNQLLDERDDIMGQLTQAQATYDQAVKAADASLAAQTASIIAARKETLATFDLTKRASAGSSVSIATLLKNASSQVETFTGFMEQLDLARARGVSQDVIDTLGLDQGPEALAQLKKINAATGEQIGQLNTLVGQRKALAGTEAQTEGDRGLGQVGADIAAAKGERDATVGQAGADLLASQQELGTQLATIGKDNARDYWDAIGQGLTSGIPTVAAAAAALRDAVTSPLAARVTITPIPGFAGGGIIPGPFIGARADNVIIRATPGEHVTPVAQARKYAPLLDAIRHDRLPRYADGGYVPAARIPGSGTSGTTGGGMGTWDLQMEVRTVVRRLDTLTDTVRDGQRNRTITGSTFASH